MALYTGRFAPTPSGPLHLGSLYTALASYLDAKSHHGRWLLRIEDLDPPREQPGATDAIIDCLYTHGLHWDGEILLQSRRTAAYQETLNRLQQQGQCFYCNCSRQQLQHCQGDYSGHCRNRHLPASNHSAVRLRTDTRLDTTFHDRLLGRQTATTPPSGCCHDFVIFRRDQLFAYQLAVVTDDIAQGVTDIVRGSDILDSTFKQAWLYHYLQQPQPRYLHLPVLNNRQGQKLSKQNLAKAIDVHNVRDNLLLALHLLNQPLPPAGECQNAHDILNWAIRHWQIQRIPAQMSISCTINSAIQ